MSAPQIYPSILNADFARLGEEIAAIATADAIHVDIMDGHFVPNLSFGPDITATVNRLTEQTLDMHLMIEEPEKWVKRYVEAGGDIITFHIEAARDHLALAAKIRDLGAQAAFSVKPGTPIEPYLGDLAQFDRVLIMSVEPGFGGQSFMPEQLDKVRTLRAVIDENNLDVVIEIDGGINFETIGRAAEAGVDAFVAGSAVYKHDNPAEAIAELRRLAAQ